MFKTVLKSLFIGLIGVSFSACANSNSHAQDSVSAHHSKILKKKRLKRFEDRKLQREKETAKKTKFCFKDSTSIHYKANQKCKK